MRGDPRIVAPRGRAAPRSAPTRRFASTEGAACTQVHRPSAAAGCSAVAVGDDELQVRSYPSSHGGDVAAAGWEHVLALDLAGPRAARRRGGDRAAHRAASARQDGTTIVLHGEQLALQVHESIGHALELDRMLLGEASYAGTSWVSAGDLGSLRYGSELLNVTADATVARRPGHVRLGRRGRRRRAHAARRRRACCGRRCPTASPRRRSASTRSGGCARAEGFARQPIVRMTNVTLEPGDAGSLADLIADTDDGPVPRDQPLVVDRRPPPAVPVRHRGRPRDPRRRARPAAAATRPTPGSRRSSGARSTRSARRPSGGCGG